MAAGRIVHGRHAAFSCRWSTFYSAQWTTLFQVFVDALC